MRKMWEFSIKKPCCVGDWVYDDLTRQHAEVLGLCYRQGEWPDKPDNSVGCWGIYLDSDWWGGLRHPWEITVQEDEA